MEPELSSHDRILQTARRLFAQDGYESTTTSAIARQAGTSESQLIKHFGSKEGLLEAIFEASWQQIGARIQQLLAQPAPPLDRLRTLGDLLVAAVENDAELKSLLLLEGRRIRKHGNSVVLTGGYLRLVGAVDGLLAEMREAGQLRPELDPQAVRSVVIGSLESLMRDRLLAERVGYPAGYGLAAVRAVFGAVLDGFLAHRG